MKERIITLLRETFSDVEIYDAPVEQGLKRPCFFLIREQAEQVKALTGSEVLRASYQLRYYPAFTGSDVQEKELRFVADELLSALRSFAPHLTREGEELCVRFTLRERAAKTQENAPVIGSIVDATEIRKGE